MGNYTIEVNNISKKYVLHSGPHYDTLRDRISALFSINKIDGEDQDRSFWALKNISFKVRQGEALGVIGRNGAGKSTLLKVLSRITPPTGGDAVLRGRVGSLLEVGTGFHQELTGRENIFLNGAILGMKNVEIKKKFDEIVDFSGVEKFLDTPVKHYSSGMYVRLAFAVAAHLDPEILLIDEVLAVGDAEFQKKCLGKMNSITRDQGRTVIFVSHNTSAIRELCKRTILLRDGKTDLIGDTDKVISRYSATYERKSGFSFIPKVSGNIPLRIIKVEITDANGRGRNSFNMFEDIEVHIRYSVGKRLMGSIVTMTLKKEGLPLLVSFDTDLDRKRFVSREVGVYESKVVIPNNILKAGYYSLDFSTGFSRGKVLCEFSDTISFQIRENLNSVHYGYDKDRKGQVALPLKWDTLTG